MQFLFTIKKSSMGKVTLSDDGKSVVMDITGDVFYFTETPKPTLVQPCPKKHESLGEEQISSSKQILSNVAVQIPTSTNINPPLGDKAYPLKQ